MKLSESKTRLKYIHKPPSELYALGNFELLSSTMPMICIVGTRRPTPYGEKVVRHIISSLAPFSPIIISGLATGIDSLAFKEALSHKLLCIGVLGSGLDTKSIYPKSNLGLAMEVVRSGGLLLSEYPPGFQSTKWSFPQRNRIMAGIAQSVVIVEGGPTSGTMITARLALEYNRDVFAVPGSIFSEQSLGPLSLINQGAIPLIDPIEIIKQAGIDIPEHLILQDKLEKESAYKRCGEKELNILHILQAYPQGIEVDELLIKTGYPIIELQLILTMLEVKKLVEEKLGKIVPL